MISAPLFVSALIGLASLGQETLWIRIVSFAQGNDPRTLAWVLALFLLGIAVGSWLGKQGCTSRNEDEIYRLGAYAAMSSSLVDAASPLLVALCAGSMLLNPVMATLIFLSSATKAVLFPVVHHLGGHWQGNNAGRSIAKIYLANILGATLAPLLIGFWLLDYISTPGLMLMMAAFSSLAVTLLAPTPYLRTLGTIITALTLTGSLSSAHSHTIWTTLANTEEGSQVSFLMENRHGIVHTSVHNNSETVYGGNLYDGKINIDPQKNTNRIDRIFLLATLHPAPQKALVIGLSSGSWTRVLSAFPTIEHIDVVEINPAYLELVKERPVVQPILHDPRIHIHIDDGRRWLRRHPGARFDLIIMNTTWHWRSYTTNLLSIEFLTLARDHLNENGIMAFNGTGSPDTLATAAQAFRYAYRWRGSNFIYAASFDFRQPDTVQAINRLEHISRNLDVSIPESLLDRLLHPSWIDINEEARLAERPLEIIKDSNMITEFKYGRK